LENVKVEGGNTIDEKYQQWQRNLNHNEGAV